MVEELYGYHKASIRISAIDVKSSASLSGKKSALSILQMHIV